MSISREPPRYPVQKHVRWGVYDKHCLFDYPFLNDLSDLKGGASGTITRSSAGWYMNRRQLLDEASANTSRLQGTGLLLETSETNRLTYNKTLTSNWVASDIDFPTLDTTVNNPEGDAGAWKLQATQIATPNLLGSQIGTLDCQTVSVYVKAGSTAKVTLAILDGVGAVYDLANFTVADDGRWHRISLVSAAGGASFAIGVGHTGIPDAVGDYIHFWFPCFTTASFLRSPIEVPAGTAVTRTGEKVTIDSSATLPARGQDFAVGFTVELLGIPTALARLMFVDGETNGRFVDLNTNGTLRAFYGGTSVTGSTVLVAGGTYRLLFTGNATSFKLYVNGVQEVTGSIGGTGSGTNSSVTLNSNNAGSFILSKVRAYSKYFDTAALAAAEKCLG